MKMVIWVTCLIFFTVFTMVGYTKNFIILPIRFIINYLSYIQRSCDWYTKRNIFPWEASKAKAIYVSEIEALRKKTKG